VRITYESSKITNQICPIVFPFTSIERLSSIPIEQETQVTTQNAYLPHLNFNQLTINGGANYRLALTSKHRDMKGPHKLRIDSSVPLEIRQVPEEGAGMHRNIIANCQVSVQSQSFFDNVVFIFKVSSVSDMQFRVHICSQEYDYKSSFNACFKIDTFYTQSVPFPPPEKGLTFEGINIDYPYATSGPYTHRYGNLITNKVLTYAENL
jgi:hypothetical protein